METTVLLYLIRQTRYSTLTTLAERNLFDYLYLFPFCVMPITALLITFTQQDYQVMEVLGIVAHSGVTIFIAIY